MEILTSRPAYHLPSAGDGEIGYDSPMKLRIVDIGFAVSDCVTRQPFRFGGNTMTWAPTLTTRVSVESEGGPGQGFAADLLVPKWFEKNPAKSARDDIEGLMQSARDAAAAVRSPQMESVFELWWRCYRERVHSQPPGATDRLLRGFGVALIERAVMDACCRVAGMSFFEALKGDLFAMEPALVYPELEGWSLAGSLESKPRDRIAVRHTIGLLDPLRREDLHEEERVRDGWPETLEEEIAHYGLRWFKLKLCGDPEKDLRRTLAFASVLGESGQENPRFTVDANEQFPDLAALVRWLKDLETRPEGRVFLKGLQYIEQPLPRGLSFDAEANAALPELSEIVPVIIDEADSGIEAFPRALDLGYGGISIKNCKGVIRALLHRGLCELRGGFQSGEDLTNLGVLALQQDLCTMASLGVQHVERNGHHYFPGLNHLPAAEIQDALRRHGDLWQERDGGVSLRIEDGELGIASLHCPGFGYDSRIAWEERTPLEAWRYEAR